jgi:predicted component of type VI protein secretion system
LLYIPDEARDVADENTGDNPQALHIRKVNARVALKGEDLTDMESLPLLRVVRNVGDDPGKARQDPDFVAPCLLLRSSPVLHELMRELTAQIDASRNDLRVKAATGGHGLEVKWELTMRLSILNRFAACLPSLVEEGVVPPFEIYLQLRELYGELLALHPEKNTFDCEAYNHLDPFRSLKELDQKIRELIRVERGREPLRVPFTTVRAGLCRAGLEDQHFTKPTAYYLGIKIPSGIDRTRLALYLTDGNKFKLMPRSMEDVAILGVELKEEVYPPLDLPGEGNLYYFRLVGAAPNQRRWEQIKQDKTACLVWNHAEFDLSGATFTLFMTLPTS